MTQSGNIYILGCGAVGLTLAACLASAGRKVIAVRTSTQDVPAGQITIRVRTAAAPLLEVSVPTVSLAQLARLEGLVVLSAKSHANPAIAAALSGKAVAGSLVIMQNGLGVERPFLASKFPQIFRCILYVTGQTAANNEVLFRPIASSPIGVIKGQELGLEPCVETLTAPAFPFHPEQNIQTAIWKKAIVNAVFNSICPLLDVDNGAFFREPGVASLAAEIIDECVVLAQAAGVSLTKSELLAQIMAISHGSDGIAISTLQDIRNGRETEMASLNLEMARLAASKHPEILLARTGFLGRMIAAKSALKRKNPQSKSLRPP